MEKNEIELTNPGPVEGTFTINLSPGPGVYELRGRRGSGKSTCLSSIDNWMTGHRVDVTLHDGALSGKVEGYGVVAPIGGRKRRKGELPFDTIDAEKFSIADLIDPPGKTPEVRDDHRIKALADLSGAKADAALYYELAGGQTEFDGLGISETQNPVMLATRIKRAFDSTARANQNTADAESDHALLLEHVPEGLDMTGSSDLASLGVERDSARDTFQRTTTDRENGIAKEDEVVQAADRLAKIEAEYTGPTIADAQAARKVAFEKDVEAAAHIKTLERKLEQACAALQGCEMKVDATNRIFEAAKSHDAAVDTLHAVASQTVTYPEASDIEQAGTAVEEATEAYNEGVRIRDVKKNHALAIAHSVAAAKAARAADEARNKAGQVFDILAQSIHTEHLEISSVDGNPRLFVQHERRGKTAFDKVNGLSDGERVDFTLRELIPHLTSPALFPVPQRVWQDLMPADRKRLHYLAVDKGLNIIGAQVDDGELRVVYLGDELEGNE